MNREVGHGATQVYARVEAGGGEADSGTWGDGHASRARFKLKAERDILKKAAAYFAKEAL